MRNLFENPSLFILPIIALVIGILSLFAKTGKDFTKKLFVAILLISLVLSCLANIWIILKNEERSNKKFKNDSITIASLTKSVGNLSDSTLRNFKKVFILLNTQTTIDNKVKISDTIITNKEEGYAFYGINYDTKWSERYFRKEHEDKLAIPKIGDIVISVSNINVRAGYIEYSNGEWKNSKIIGAIGPNEKFKVLDVKPILGSFIWIKFKRN